MKEKEGAFLVQSKTNNISFSITNPMPSSYLDDLISNPSMLFLLGSDSGFLLTFIRLEKKVANDYALMIDTKLRAIFKRFDIDYFSNPIGFLGQVKPNLLQREYVEIRNQFEHLMQKEIKYQKNPDVQLNAFRRWIDIADDLLQRHCYEGFLLISVNLLVQARDFIIKGLPDYYQKKYECFCTLIHPRSCHKNLKNYIKNNRSKNDFCPIIFWVQTLNSILETISDKKNGLELLLRDKIVLNKKDQKHKIAILHSINILETKKTEILLKILAEQNQKLETLPTHLDNTFNQMRSSYNKDSIKEARVDFSSTPKTPIGQMPSSLFSHKLIPPQGSSGTQTREAFWQEAFTKTL